MVLLLYAALLATCLPMRISQLISVRRKSVLVSYVDAARISHNADVGCIRVNGLSKNDTDIY